METGLENVPEIIQCYGFNRGSWKNISGATFTGTVEADGPFGKKKYRYAFNHLWNKKVTFCLELYGREFQFLESFEIIKITTK
jgi:hypothetical protein